MSTTSTMETSSITTRSAARGLVACAESPALRIELQQAMDGFRLQAGGLAEAFGGAAGGRAQQHAHALGAQGLEDTGHNGGLAHPRPASDDRDFAVSTWATAARCEAASVRPVCRSTQGMAFAGSMAPQGGAPSSRCRSCVATPTSARYSGASSRQGWPSMVSAMRRSSWTSRVIACAMVVSGISRSVVAASMSSAWTTAQWPSSANSAAHAARRPGHGSRHRGECPGAAPACRRS